LVGHIYAPSARDLCSPGEHFRKEAGTNAIVTELPLKVFLLFEAIGPIFLY
jgi:hypothetical protein